jgi:serine protease Do
MRTLLNGLKEALMIAEQEILSIAGAADELAEVVAQVRDSVVLVRSGREGAGSGVIWRADGIVMTNHHVVARRQHATVVLNDNRELRAEVIARDPVLDLAALRVDATDLPVATVGASQALRIGELVVAIGNPWGQRNVVTAGIVSGVGAIETGWRRGKAEYIRSDVGLAPGNSGGALVDARGTVVGINAMIFGGDLGVAIPSHIATQFLAVAEGRRPLLGVGVQLVELPESLRAAAKREHGLLLAAVDPAGAADRAGLYIGDVLLDIDDKPLADAHTLAYTLAQYNLGSQIVVRYLRGGVVRTSTVELSTAAEPFQAAA